MWFGWRAGAARVQLFVHGCRAMQRGGDGGACKYNPPATHRDARNNRIKETALHIPLRPLTQEHSSGPLIDPSAAAWGGGGGGGR